MLINRYMAHQFGNPSGPIGALLGYLWNVRNSTLNDAAFNHLALTPKDRVLEVGFGGGYLLRRMSAVVTDGCLAGVDLSATMLALCQKRFRPLLETGRLALSRALAEALPFPDAYFTKACSVNSIFYWQDPFRALGELARVLAPDALLVLCFTCRQSLAARRFSQYISLYEVPEVVEALSALGIQVTVHSLADRHREFVCLVGRKLLRPVSQQ